MATLKRPDGNLPGDFHLSRRGLAGAIFAGYALAAFSAEAEPIHTGDDGLVTETVQLATADGSHIRGYIARPKASGRFPAVIVVNEVFGLHAYILDICRRFAHLGYVAIAPGYFDRAGDPAPLPMTQFDQIRKIVATATDQQVMGDTGVAIKYLQAQPYVEGRKIAITGFCWGGKVVWNACQTFPELKAGVAWYGQMAPVGDAPPDPANPRLWPVEHAADQKCPVLGLYGGKDPLSQAVPQMEAALKAAGKTGSILHVYPDAGHGFHADYRDSYVEADAKDGWARLLAFYAANGVAPRAYKAT
ncbi:MAG TPA: dienelactone hydrolase family protein [Caulobacteraceae bacterium]|nr:dienelactone hydrolase family protein [Caulobacteraceae bacterium]